MNCNHKEWVYPPPAENTWTGEMEDQPAYERSIQDDISIGSFKCRRCGEVGYYTGQWKRYFEEGVPCFGSEGVSRESITQTVTQTETPPKGRDV